MNTPTTTSLQSLEGEKSIPDGIQKLKGNWDLLKEILHHRFNTKGIKQLTEITEGLFNRGPDNDEVTLKDLIQMTRDRIDGLGPESQNIIRLGSQLQRLANLVNAQGTIEQPRWLYAPLNI